MDGDGQQAGSVPSLICSSSSLRLSWTGLGLGRSSVLRRLLAALANMLACNAPAAPATGAGGGGGGGGGAPPGPGGGGAPPGPGGGGGGGGGGGAPAGRRL